MYNALLFARISTTGIRLSSFNTRTRKSLPPIAARVYKFKNVWCSMKIILPYPEHINKKTEKKKENKKCTRVSHHGANEISTYFTWHTHRTFFTIVRILLWPAISLAKHSFRSTGPRSINCLSRVLGRPRVARNLHRFPMWVYVRVYPEDVWATRHDVNLDSRWGA